MIYQASGLSAYNAKRKMVEGPSTRSEYSFVAFIIRSLRLFPLSLVLLSITLPRMVIERVTWSLQYTLNSAVFVSGGRGIFAIFSGGYKAFSINLIRITQSATIMAKPTKVVKKSVPFAIVSHLNNDDYVIAIIFTYSV